MTTHAPEVEGPSVYVGTVQSIKSEETPGKPMHVLRLIQRDLTHQDVIVFGDLAPQQGHEYAFVTAFTPTEVRGKPLAERVVDPTIKSIFKAMADVGNTSPADLNVNMVRKANIAVGNLSRSFS